MKILLIHNRMPDALSDRFWRAQCFQRALQEAGHEAVLLTPEPGSLNRFRIWSGLRLLLQALRLRWKTHYDAIHFTDGFAWTALSPCWGSVFKLYDPPRCGSRETGCGTRSLQGLLRRPRCVLERKLLLRMDAIVCHCPLLLEELSRLDRRVRTTLIEGPARPLPTASGTAPGFATRSTFRPVFADCSALEWSGIELLLRAFKLITRRPGLPKLVVLLRSDQPRKKLREWILRLDLEEHCHRQEGDPREFTGWIAAQAAVLVLPARESRYPDLRLISCMQCGVPIVATRIAAHLPYLDEERALLVRPNPDALAEGIYRTLNEPLLATATAQAAQAYAAAHFTRSGFNCKVRSLYSGLAERSRSEA